MLTFDPVILGSEVICSKIQGNSLFEVHNFFRNDSILHFVSSNAYITLNKLRNHQRCHILYHYS